MCGIYICIYGRRGGKTNLPNRILPLGESPRLTFTRQSSRVVARDTQVLHIKVGCIRGPTAPTGPEHLVVDNHIKRLADHVRAVLRREQVPVDVEARLQRRPVVLGPQLHQDGMPRRRGRRVGVVLGGDLTARVEGVEADFAVALPLGQVNLGRPAVDAVEPKGGPAALLDRGDKVGLEVEAAVGVHGEVLLGVDGAARVGVVRVARVEGLELQVGVVNDGGLGRGHEGGAVVGIAPRVVVREVGLEVVLAVEAGVGDEGGGAFLEGAFLVGVTVGGRGGPCEEEGPQGEDASGGRHGDGGVAGVARRLWSVQCGGRATARGRGKRRGARGAINNE